MTPSPQERRRRILDRVSVGSVSVRDLVKSLRVSEITVRRDLAFLEQEDRLLRVHGGAVPSERVAYEFSFKEKEQQNREAKETIGLAAAALVEPSDAVFLDTGTTALAVARALRAVKPRVIITVNLCVASEYVGQNDVRVLVPGGELGRLSPDLFGEWTLAMLSRVSADVAFIGCDSLLLKEGFFTADPRAAAVAGLMLERARRPYLVADSSKFGRRSLCRIGVLNALAGVITDHGVGRETRRALKRLGVDLILGKR